MQLRIIWKNLAKLDFVILGINFALNKYCLWSWDHSVQALRYAAFGKNFCY